MGTNYYVEFEPCDKCGLSRPEYHIGNSSAGWCFSLHVEPEQEIRDLGDVQKLWEEGAILDEYSQVIPPERMLRIITQRQGEKKEDKPVLYKSWNEFHKDNYSEPGPHYLIRYKISEEGCIGHGKGTWDLITGEFS